jgi:hypothetical protein
MPKKEPEHMVCEACGQVMDTGVGCKISHYRNSKGIKTARIPYGEELHGWDCSIPCHDCGVIAGQFHHPGCDVEECPLCNRQLLMCDCDV